jgi:hypothetical protein
MTQTLITLFEIHCIVNTKLNIFIYIYFLMTASLVYIVWNWPYTPQDVINDIEKLGMWGILLDVCFLLPIVVWWRNKRLKKTESLIYQRNECK